MRNILTDEEIHELLTLTPDHNGFARAIEDAVVKKLNYRLDQEQDERKIVFDHLSALGFVRLKPGQVVAERRVIDSGEEGNWHYELFEVKPE